MMRPGRSLGQFAKKSEAVREKRGSLRLAQRDNWNERSTLAADADSSVRPSLVDGALKNQQCLDGFAIPLTL